jgi:hypothetical protein
MKSMKRIGDVGDPCGRPDWICTVDPVSPSRRTAADRCDMKLATQCMIFGGQPCSRSLRTLPPGRTASKAPRTSRVNKMTTLPRARLLDVVYHRRREVYCSLRTSLAGLRCTVSSRGPLSTVRQGCSVEVNEEHKIPNIYTREGGMFGQ